ncbi:MAG: DUF4331 family protein [Bacteroidota bacterium]|nr:DUF4331 family protein [Bacteroidota bacterium]
MKKRFTTSKLNFFIAIAAASVFSVILMSSSHREAPLIAYDPLADNTDVYAFRDPNHDDKIIIIANYIPGQLPEDGPNYENFGENIRYEIHIKNDATTKGDDITYRFTFKKVNEDPTTIFHIRLGKENQKDTYKLERYCDGSWQTIINNGIVPPPNIGPRSIQSKVGLGAPDYQTLMRNAIATANTGEKVFAGPVDDPFFAELGGIFDLGDAPRTDGTHPEDHLKCKNVSTIALEVPIRTLQKNHKGDEQIKNILDPDYVIGVWASASRQRIKVLNSRGDGKESFYGDWVQVSRLGMPLDNEAINPFGVKDLWNSLSPYQDASTQIKLFGDFFYNPELALYMDDAKFGTAVPALKPLRIQKNSLGMFGFGNGQNGLYGLTEAQREGTALDGKYQSLLLPGPGKPRSVDIWPIFNTGVPNMRPFQLATGKGGNPLAEGKPFINNFLPVVGDMLRLNMAVPATPRDSKDFSPLGLVQAGVLGLTDARFNKNKKLQWIPNMDGFPNGRRLEDDAIRIELQTVSGVVLAAIGLPYDDYVAGGSLATPALVGVLQYHTGVDKNDTTLSATFPYEQTPWSGKHNCTCDFGAQTLARNGVNTFTETSTLGFSSPELIASSSPNPMVNHNTVVYKLDADANVQISVYNSLGQPIKTLANQKQAAGMHTIDWQAQNMTKGTYFIQLYKDGGLKQTIKVIKE